MSPRSSAAGDARLCGNGPNIHVLGVNPKSGKSAGRIYVDPHGENIDGGLIRARLIDSKEAHQRYG